MTTQALQNPATILATPAPSSGKPSASSGAPEMPFSQVLQREVTERGTADRSPRPESRPSDASPDTPSSTAGKSSSEPLKESQEASGTKENPDSEVQAAPSAELLALVANMTALAAATKQADESVSDTASELQTAFDALAGIGRRDAADNGKLLGTANADMVNHHAGFASAWNAAANSSKAGVGTDDSALHFSAAQNEISQSGKGTPLAGLSNAAEPIPSALDPASGSLSPQSLLPMQQALNRLNAATPHGTESLAPQVGTPAWDQAVGQKVVWMVAGSQQSASLTLNPPDLGPMQIVLNVNNSQANATFVAAQPEVRQALEAALPRLREMLGEAGIQLGQANINAGTPQHGGGAEQHGRPSSSHTAHDQHGDQAPVVVRQQAIRQGLGMVDTFA